MSRLHSAGVVGVILIAVAVIWIVAGSPHPWRNPPALTPASGTDGTALYQTYCATCHGARGEGQPNWKTKKPDGIYPAPPHDASGHTWHHADGLLFRTVRDGGQAAAPADFKSGMPGWKDTLTDAQIVAVLQYLKTLWGPAERQFQTEVSQRDPYPAQAR
jgi:mono/diheme cytochrome c family protein